MKVAVFCSANNAIDPDFFTMPDGLGRRTLEAYAADPRRAYAAHARLALSK